TDLIPTLHEFQHRLHKVLPVGRVDPGSTDYDGAWAVLPYGLLTPELGLPIDIDRASGIIFFQRLVDIPWKDIICGYIEQFTAIFPGIFSNLQSREMVYPIGQVSFCCCLVHCGKCSAMDDEVRPNCIQDRSNGLRH